MSSPLLLKFFPSSIFWSFDHIVSPPQHLLDPLYLSTHATSSSFSLKKKKKMKEIFLKKKANEQKHQQDKKNTKTKQNTQNTHRVYFVLVNYSYMYGTCPWVWFIHLGTLLKYAVPFLRRYQL